MICSPIFPLKNLRTGGEKQQGRQPQGADRLAAGGSCRQEKRRKVHDLRRTHLGGRKRRHRDVPVLHLHHRRDRRQRGLRDRINNTSAEHIAPRLLCNMAFLKLHKNIAFQNVLRVSKNASPVNPVLNRVAQDVELC